MKKNLKNYTISALLLLVSVFFNFINAQENPEPPNPLGRGVGPGAAPTSPIDMYQIFLFGIAIFLIAYFYKKLKLVRN